MKITRLLPIYILGLTIVLSGTVFAEDINNDEFQQPREGIKREMMLRGSAPRTMLKGSGPEVRERLGGSEPRNKMEEESLQQRCDRIAKLVLKRLDIFETTKTNHQENYQKLLTRLNNIVTKLNEKDIDTTKLSTDIATLEGMITDYTTQYESFVVALKETVSGFTCTAENKDAFKDLLEQTKEDLKALKDSRQAIREFYLNTIREDLRFLRAGIEANKQGDREVPNPRGLRDRGEFEGDSTQPTTTEQEAQ